MKEQEKMPHKGKKTDDSQPTPITEGHSLIAVAIGTLTALACVCFLFAFMSIPNANYESDLREASACLITGSIAALLALLLFHLNLFWLIRYQADQSKADMSKGAFIFIELFLFVISFILVVVFLLAVLPVLIFIYLAATTPR